MNDRIKTKHSNEWHPTFEIPQAQSKSPSFPATQSAFHVRQQHHHGIRKSGRRLEWLTIYKKLKSKYK
jgi:hypothetical protein